MLTMGQLRKECVHSLSLIHTHSLTHIAVTANYILISAFIWKIQIFLKMADVRSLFMKHKQYSTFQTSLCSLIKSIHQWMGKAGPCLDQQTEVVSEPIQISPLPPQGPTSYITAAADGTTFKRKLMKNIQQHESGWAFFLQQVRCHFNLLHIKTQDISNLLLCCRHQTCIYKLF